MDEALDALVRRKAPLIIERDQGGKKNVRATESCWKCDNCSGRGNLRNIRTREMPSFCSRYQRCFLYAVNETYMQSSGRYCEEPSAARSPALQSHPSPHCVHCVHCVHCFHCFHCFLTTLLHHSAPVQGR